MKMDVTRMRKSLVFVCLLNFLSKSECANDTIDDIYDFVYEGYKYISFPSGSDYILVLGETGIGKTPFTKWMTIDNSLLESIQLVEDGPYLMKDVDGKIGTEETRSATIYPDLYPTNDSTVFYDFPGFRDTRGTKFELGITYFIKRVVNRAERIKILFLTDFDTVKRNGARNRLTNAVKDVCYFIKDDVSKFQNSIAMVVTKVPKYINDNKMSDEKAIRYIENSIISIKDELKNRGENACGVQLIESISNKIGIFRYPDRAGLFSGISILQPGKINIEHLIANSLNFVNTTESDFGYSISSDSKLFVKDLLEKILNTKCAESVFEICDRIEEEYIDQINTVEDIELLNESVSVGAAMLDNVSNSNPLIFIENLMLVANKLKLNVRVDGLNNSLEYMRFLLTVENSTLTTSSVFITKLANIKRQITNKYDEHIDAEVENLLEREFPTDFKTIADQILTYHLEIQQFTNDIDTIRQNAQNISIALKNIKGDVSITKDQFTYFQELINATNVLQIGISPSILEPITERLKKIQFLYHIRNKTESTSHEMIEKVDDLVNRIDESFKLYSFLDSLFNNIEFSKDAAAQVIGACADRDDTSLKNITELHLPQLLENSETDLASIKDLKFNSFQRSSLKKILTVLTENLDIKCPDGENMLARGMSIKLSEVIHHSCWSDSKSIKIFALKSVTIDNDIEKAEKVERLTIIAPIWRIYGQRKFILTGEEGEAYDEAAPNAKDTSQPGLDGKGGRPGGPGGSFVGIGETFVNGHQLEIVSNGGRGGSGQRGGNGAKGKNGTTPELQLLECYTRFKVTQLHIYKGCINDLLDGKYEYSWRKVESHNEELFVHGTKAVRPGNGGNGGNAGARGLPGNVELIELKEPSNCVKRADYGENGPMGKGGSGGEATHSWNFILNHITKISLFSTEYKVVNRTEEADTVFGDDGSAGKGINDAGRRNAVPITEFSFVINEFKSYCREQITDVNYGIRGNQIKAFLNRLIDNEEIDKFYDINGFINDLDSMELNYLDLKNKLDFVPFLDNFLQRIVEFSKNGSASDAKKKVLSYLYTSALSKLYVEQNKIRKNTIYNLQEFLTSLKEDIKDLNEKTKNEIISSYRDAFKESLEKKSDDSKAFIDDEIKSEVDNLYKTIDDRIDTLLNDVIKEEEKAIKDLETLKKQKIELENTAILRLLLAPLKTVGPIASVFGPQGAIVGAVLTTSSSVVENLVLDNKSGEGADKIATIKGTYQEPLKRLTDQINGQYSKFKTQVDEIDIAIKQYEETEAGTAIPTELDVSKIRKEIDACKEVIKERDNDRYAGHWTTIVDEKKKKLVGLLAEFKTAQEQRKDAMKDEEELPIKKKVADQIDVVNYIISGMNVIEAGVDVYNKYKNDKAKIEKIDEAIQKQNETIENHKKREKDINDIGMTYIRTAKSDLDNFVASNYSAQLLIKKWKMQNFFRDMRSAFSKLAKDFSVDEDIQLCLTKIDEGMATMIDIYDRINSYSETQQMVSYIANIQSAGSQGISLPDELSRPVNRLENIIKSNLLIEGWDKAIRATKQHYFPMIITFFQTYKLPSGMQTNDTNSVKEMAIQQIDALLKTIKGESSISTEYDECFHSNAVFNGTVNDPAFYRWPHGKFKNKITGLLKGENVTIKSDIVDGVDFNAVKFRKIAIYFKLKNESRQNEFDMKFGNIVTYLTMFGTNYYRCHNRIYSIALDQNIPLDFQYTNMRWKNPNETFNKIQRNSAFLSPYGMWKIRISGNLTDLAMFQNEPMDLELRGIGSYLKHSKFTDHVCNRHLDDYYSFYKLMSE